MDGTASSQTHEAATGPLAPVAFPVKIRTSLAHYVLGNIGMAALLYALVRNQLSIWWCVAIVTVFAVALTLLSGHRMARNSERYLRQRLAELQPMLGEGESAQMLAKQDQSSALRVSPLNPIFALPGLVCAVWIAVITFNVAETALDNFYWAVRLPAAFVAAVAHFMVLLVLWASVNYTPAYARFNLAKLRKEHDEANDQQEVATRLSAEDHNDIQIINQQAHLDSLHRRVETYTLESALLSALSFSSFLTIAMAESNRVEGNFIDQLGKLATASLEWRDQPFELPLPGNIMIDKVPVLPPGFLEAHNVALIALALLLCATTFLGVLVARLRFNDGYREADSVLKAANKLNDKQEKVVRGGDASRHDTYAKAIATMLEKSAQLQRGLDLMLTYMRLSRSAGILFFIIALGLCGLLFSWIVMVAIFVVMGCAWVVGYIDTLVRSIRRRDVFNERGVGMLLKPFRRKKLVADG